MLALIWFKNIFTKFPPKMFIITRDMLNYWILMKSFWVNNSIILTFYKKTMSKNAKKMLKVRILEQPYN